MSELIKRPVVEEWVGDRLTDQEWRRLVDAIPNSSIPEALQTIVWESIRGGRYPE